MQHLRKYCGTDSKHENRWQVHTRLGNSSL